jgi:RimJ/RimL family protein N-acetyltransferase
VTASRDTAGPRPLVALRPVEDADLGRFFAHMQDPEALRMAAFTPKDPADRAAFDAHWRRILGDAAILNRTILADGAVAGHVASFLMEGGREVTYWIDRALWGRGVATAALRAFLEVDPIRPLHARAAKDNLGSLRVLEKCGFRAVGEDRGFANARNAEIEECLLLLES